MSVFTSCPSDVSTSSVGDAASLCWLSSGDVLLLFSLQLKNRLGYILLLESLRKQHFTHGRRLGVLVTS